MQSNQAFQVSLPDGATLAGDRYGDGPPVVLISGLGGTAAFWRPLVPFLENHTVLAFDQRGIGQSTRGTAPVTIEQLAHDVLHILQQLRLGPATLVGHSTGGCIAMECALLAPQAISKLVLSGTWSAPDNYMANLFEMRLQALRTDLGLYEKMGAYLSYPAQWLVTHPDVQVPAPRPHDAFKATVIEERIAALLRFNRRADLAKLSQPALVLGAEDDMVVPVHLQKAVAQELRNCRSHYFEHGGHFYPVSRTNDFAGQVLAWLQEA